MAQSSFENRVLSYRLAREIPKTHMHGYLESNNTFSWLQPNEVGDMPVIVDTKDLRDLGSTRPYLPAPTLDDLIRYAKNYANIEIDLNELDFNAQNLVDELFNALASIEGENRQKKSSRQENWTENSSYGRNRYSDNMDEFAQEFMSMGNTSSDYTEAYSRYFDEQGAKLRRILQEKSPKKQPTKEQWIMPADIRPTVRIPDTRVELQMPRRMIYAGRTPGGFPAYYDFHRNRFEEYVLDEDQRTILSTNYLPSDLSSIEERSIEFNAFISSRGLLVDPGMFVSCVRSVGLSLGALIRTGLQNDGFVYRRSGLGTIRCQYDSLQRAYMHKSEEEF